MAEGKEKQQSIGALWKQVTKDGSKTYLSGNLQLVPDGEKIKIIVFSNKNKPEGSTQPDFRIFRSLPQKKETSET